MPLTIRKSEITSEHLPFLAAVDNGDDTVTLFYSNDILPQLPIEQKIITTQYGLRVALERKNLSQRFENALLQLPVTEQIRLKWLSRFVESDAVLIKALVLAGLTQAEIKDLFELAQKEYVTTNQTPDPVKPK